MVLRNKFREFTLWCCVCNYNALAIAAASNLPPGVLTNVLIGAAIFFVCHYFFHF